MIQCTLKTQTFYSLETLCLNECSQLKSLQLSFRRNLNVHMMELLNDRRSSIWHVYDPILTNIRSNVIRCVTFDCSLCDIESSGISAVQDRLCKPPFLGLEEVWFSVVCDSYGDSYRRSRLTPLWKLGFEKLRRRYSVQIVFCNKVDIDPLCEASFGIW